MSLCLSLSQLLPLKVLQTHLPHTSKWDVQQLLTGPIFPPLPIQAKKTHQGKSLGVFLKRKRRGISELSAGDGSIEQIFAMSCLCQDQRRLWRAPKSFFAGVGLSCRAVGSEPPLSLRDLLVATGCKCWDVKGMCVVLVMALKSCRSDRRPWAPNLGVMERSLGYLETPWQQHLYRKSWWLLQALSWSRSWYQGRAAEEEHWSEVG